MNEFRITTTDREEISLQSVTEKQAGVHLLPGAERMLAKGRFGKMLFQHVAGEGFDIWFSNYRMLQPVKLIGGSDLAILEFHAHYSNPFPTAWKGLGDGQLQHRQYQISYVPWVETEGLFPQGQSCDTFDIHFHREILQPYAEFCPRLGHLLEDVERRRPASMLEVVRFLSPGMEEAMRSMLNYAMHEGLLLQYFKGKVHELLVNMVHQVGLIDSMPTLSAAEIRHAEQAMKIILSDFSVYDSVEQLARKVGTSEHRLQMAFKYVYGTTVGKFSKEERMKRAHQILSETNEILLSVALSIGYNDPGNFATAFRNHFGYTPGTLQKRKKFR
jgi:AraC-like DNA-binding protein